jgi:hypothetical protein
MSGEANSFPRLCALNVFLPNGRNKKRHSLTGYAVSLSQALKKVRTDFQSANYY